MHADGRGAAVESDDIAAVSFIYPDSTGNTTTTIFRFLPTSASAGETILIRGQNFSNLKSVKIGSATAKVISSSDTDIAITIPSNASTGKIKVTTNLGKAVSREKLTVTP